MKEVKSKDKTIHEESEKKDNEEKTKVNSMTVLGDLPPLNGKTETKNKMNEIRAIIDQGLNLDNYEDDDFHVCGEISLSLLFCCSMELII